MTTSFSSFSLPDSLLKNLEKIGFQEPTPIQVKAIPYALEGKDILGTAGTGTGKTGAFSIPLLAQLFKDPEKKALIITPTRELASQVLSEIKKMMGDNYIRTALLIGGDPIIKQFKQLKAKPRIIVGTPGRINDHLKRKNDLFEKYKLFSFR